MSLSRILLFLVGAAILVLSLALLVWTFWPAQTLQQVAPIPPNAIQLPIPTPTGWLLPGIGGV